jgi:tetratricopeptide (TPR) repeat protein
MLKLTQCMIVKNEEKNLPRSLCWGKGLVDELIVVDTGSSDGTVALAQELGAEVLRFQWVDDFSAARNFAISRCSGDWILFLDADEYFSDADAQLLRPLLEGIDELCEPVNWEKRFYNVVDTPWLNMGSDGPARQTRIFRNLPFLRYAGAVHEQLHALPGGYLKVYSVPDKPAIHHTGYVWSQENSKQAKGERNFAVAQKALETSPGCAKYLLFAAEALMDMGEYARADETFFQAMQNGDGSIWPERVCEGYKQWLSACLHLWDQEADHARMIISAARAYTQAVSLFPDDADFDLLLSLFYFKVNDLPNTIRFFSASLSKKGGRITQSFISSDRATYDLLRVACEKLMIR